MMLTLLWTDIMVWLLIFVVVVWSLMASRSSQVRKQWHTIFKSSIAMASATVLLFYILFTLLDSIHFRLATTSSTTESQKVQHGEMITVLDLLFSHNIKNTERTYSAPFSTHEYAKSIVVDESGVTQQEYLPLKHVSKDDNILSKSIFAIFTGVFIAGLLIFVHIVWRKRKGFKRELPWRTAYLTLLFLVVTFAWFYMLSYHYHVLGTDKVGGDVLYQSLKSIRTGVLIGILTTLIMLPVAVILGVSAGLFGGWVDDVIQYLYTTLSSIPGVLLIAAGVLSMQVMMDNNPTWFETTLERSDLRLLFLILILGITSWTGLCRLIRAETLKISQVEFVTAAKAFGVGKLTIIR